jgi:ABC-2 type transport system ATP-binding protein
VTVLAGTPVIELDALTVRLGGRSVLESLGVKLTGRAIGLLGPNGAGKSTLLNTLLGFYRPTAGTARLLGLDVREHGKTLRARVGYMPENDAFLADMTGVHFVRYMAELAGLPPREALERAHEAFFYVGLGEARYRKVGTYSLGMKQLVKLAQALAHGPELLLLDEPTNGLDPHARSRMIKLIRDIRDAGQMRVMLSSHLLRDVEECCDEVLILKAGRVAAHCDLEEERRANRRFLEIETSARGAELTDAVRGLGCECAFFAANGTGGGRLKVVLPEGVEVRDLYRLAGERDVLIRRMSFRRNSLEDLFLEAMDQTGAPHGGS